MKLTLRLLATAALLAFTTHSARALTVPVAQDTYTNTTGTNKTIASGNGSSASLDVNIKQSALIRFDLTDLDVIPATITAENIKSAILRLYVISAKSVGVDDTLTVHAITSDWSEHFTGKPVALPAISGSAVGTIPAADLGVKKFVSVDITAAVVNALQNGSDFGFAIMTSASTAKVVLASKEGTATGVAAQLDIDANLADNGTGNDITQNITLPLTTGSTGIIFTGGQTLLHDFGTDNLFAGVGAGNLTMSGGDNTAIGASALFSNTTGGGNVAIGSAALDANTMGAANTAIGFNALIANTTGYRNTATGFTTLHANTTGYENTAYGQEALYSNTTGIDNTAVGFQPLHSNTAGIHNIAIGTSALYSNTTANHNLAIGYNALFTQSFSNSGTAWNSFNVAVGFQALTNNQPTSTSNGINNTALGASALQNNTTGFNNTSSGFNALLSNTSGDSNAALGKDALTNNTTGQANTALGSRALSSNTTGSENIAIGENAGSLVNGGSNNIIIASAGVPGENGGIHIGNPNQTAAYIAAIRGVTTGNNDAVTVMIDSNGQLGTVSSSRRYKEDINDMGNVSARLLSLRPVTFRYKKTYNDGGKPIQFGLIAEEVAEVFPELTVFNADGKPETVKYDLLAPLLLNEFQKEHKRVEDLEKTGAEQREQIRALADRVIELSRQMEKVSRQLEERDAHPVPARLER